MAVVKIPAVFVPAELAYRVCNAVNDTKGHASFDPIGQEFLISDEPADGFALRNFSLLVSEVSNLADQDPVGRMTCEFRWGDIYANTFIETVKKAYSTPDRDPIWIQYGKGCISIRHTKSTIKAITTMIDVFNVCMNTRTDGSKANLLVKLIGKGWKHHRDILPRINMTGDDFARLVKHMIKSGTILAHKEGRGTVYSLKGAE